MSLVRIAQLEREYEAARARLHAWNRAEWKRKLAPIPRPVPAPRKTVKPVELKDPFGTPFTTPKRPPLPPAQRRYPKYREAGA